jgi:hypothetical protein
MPNASAVADIFSVQVAAWTTTTAVCLFIFRLWNVSPAMFAQWIAYRRSRAEEKAADWKRRGDEIKRLDDRCKALEVAETRCREDLADAKERIAILEGYQIGRGTMRQEVTVLEVSQRVNEEDKK